jgi:hypothetical protein
MLPVDALQDVVRVYDAGEVQDFIDFFRQVYTTVLILLLPSLLQIQLLLSDITAAELLPLSYLLSMLVFATLTVTTASSDYTLTAVTALPVRTTAYLFSVLHLIPSDQHGLCYTLSQHRTTLLYSTMTGSHSL